jgi:soluble lytic murein transglycosylase-like protein
MDKYIIGFIMTVLALFMFVGVAKPEDVDMEAIIVIESNGDANAYNVRSQARGLCQITGICLKEWNLGHLRDQYSLDDLYNPGINLKIATWYMNKKIPRYLDYYGIPDTVETRLIAYNWGIGRLRSAMRAGDFSLDALPSETRQYIKKYNELTGR